MCMYICLVSFRLVLVIFSFVGLEFGQVTEGLAFEVVKVTQVPALQII